MNADKLLMFPVTSLIFLFFLPLRQGVSGALAVLMKDAIKPTLMQTLEVRHAHNPT